MGITALIVFIASMGMLLVRNVTHTVWLLAVEGVALSVMVFLSRPITLEQTVIGLVTIFIKAGVIPFTMNRVTLTWPQAYRTDRPLPWWGYLAGIALVLSVTHIIHLLSPVGIIHHRDLFFYGLASIYLGLLQMISRRHVLSQVGSLIAVENALVILAASVAGQLPMFMEFGMLIDLLVAVVILSWISRLVHHQFNTTDVTVMRFLRR